MLIASCPEKNLTSPKLSGKLMIAGNDCLNNVFACHLCTDVAVLNFSAHHDVGFGNGPPFLWRWLISGAF